MTRIEWVERYLAQAEQLIMEGDQAEGMALLQNLLYEEPGYGSLHNHLGWAHLYYTEDDAQAELHLKAAVQFDPQMAPSYLHLGNLYMRNARYNDAIAILEKGVRQPKANRVAFLETIAQAYELRFEYRKAIHAYQEALASSVGWETNNLLDSIKRCRRKRWALFFRGDNRRNQR